jgi:hypothetical protein
MYAINCADAVQFARSCIDFAASVFSHLRVALFMVATLSGCVITPTIDPVTHAQTCCSAYATYFGYDFSGTYKKTGNQWNTNGSVKWKYLNGP